MSGIPLAEVEKLNPEVKLSELLGGEKILLPAGFYTQREKEVLGVSTIDLPSIK
jgi:hypothetical protein